MLVILWVLLAIYIIATRDPIGYVILALVTVFLGLPALVLYLGNRGRAPSEHETGPDHDRPGSNGASGML
jgi:hypothetical protein